MIKRVALLGLAASLGCRASLPVEAESLPGTIIPGVAPKHIAVAVTRGAPGVHATVSVGAEVPLEIRDASVSGPDAALFRLVPGPRWPLRLRAREELPIALEIAAPAGTSPGVRRARLTLVFGGNASASVVELTVLVMKESGPEHEPALQDIVSALGYGTKIGSTAFILGTGSAPLGDELPGGWFRRAGPGPLSITTVASFTSPGARRFGYTMGPPPAAQVVGVLDGDQNQHLHPTFEGGAQTATFDPGDAGFALWVERGDARYHSADRLNKERAHAARIYPLKDADGATLPGRWLVAFEESTDGDYQDLVLLLANAQNGIFE